MAQLKTFGGNCHVPSFPVPWFVDSCDNCNWLQEHDDSGRAPINGSWRKIPTHCGRTFLMMAITRCNSRFWCKFISCIAKVNYARANNAAVWCSNIVALLAVGPCHLQWVYYILWIGLNAIETINSVGKASTATTAFCSLATGHHFLHSLCSLPAVLSPLKMHPKGRVPLHCQWNCHRQLLY